MNKKNTFSLSIVVPVFNEEQSIEILFGEINNSVNSLKNCTEYEIIFIDDGSTDKSWKIEKEIWK